MKPASIALALLCAVAALTGCSGFWDPPSNTSTTTTTTTLSSGYFFVLDSATSQIVSYEISSGTLTEVGSYAVPSTPFAMAVAPNDAYLEVSSANGIYAYTISSGILTIENSSQPIAADPAVAMVIDSTDAWLIETSGLGTLYAIPVATSTGLPSTTASNCTGTSIICQVPLTGATIHQLAIAPNNDYVFAAADANGTAAFAFTAANSNPFGSKAYATIAVSGSSGSAYSVAVDTSTRLLYAGETGTSTSSGGGLRVFTIGSGGTLTELSGSPYASGGTNPRSILPKSTGDVVYVANWNGTSDGNIAGFAIADTNGTFSLTRTSNTATTGIEPVGIVEDSDKNFVIAVNSGGSPNLDAYFFDTTTTSKLDLTLYSSAIAGAAIVAEH